MYKIIDDDCNVLVDSVTYPPTFISNEKLATVFTNKKEAAKVVTRLKKDVKVIPSLKPPFEVVEV